MERLIAVVTTEASQGFRTDGGKVLVLGIHQGHDSSAAIVRDGKIIADVAEERFTRLKHCNHVPSNAISYCLKAAGVENINEVDLVAIPAKTGNTLVQIVLGVHQPSKSALKRAMKAGLASRGYRRYGEDVRPPIYFPDFRLEDPDKLVFVEHHLAHAASAYFTQPSPDRCLVFTVDGVGDGVSMAVWVGEGDQIHPLQRLGAEASVGWAYSIVTEALHWWHGDGEGKTMGLAPYGDHEKCAGVLDHLFPVFNGTKLEEPIRLGQAFYWAESGSTQFHFEEAYEVEALADRLGRENIAAEAQRKLEECVGPWVDAWVKKERCPRTAFAGGVFLNVKLNQRIWNNRGSAMTEQHVFPNPGDAGLALGAALHAYHQQHRFEGYELDDIYWGPEFANDYIKHLLDDRHLSYTLSANPAKEAAELLADNKIVAWFQGRMESGPRSLGNRSILMSPLKPENKDIINAKVKFREAFRPFCPSLLWEKRHDYLEDVRDECFMITSFDVKPEKRDAIPAVVHVDGTVRPQMVRRESNARYWDLINEFGKITGEYILLNTSFNTMGEPIINTPSEAIRCFYDGGLDALFLGDYLLRKGF